MKIKDLEKELFNKWEDRIGFSKFIRDGVVDETRFLKEKVKFVFVLKEANDLGMPLDEFLQGGGGNAW